MSIGICTTHRCVSRSCSACATSGRSRMPTPCARRSRRTAAARGGCSAAFRCRIVFVSPRPAASLGALVRISVPAEGELRAIVADVAAKVAQFLGQATDATAFDTAIDEVAGRVAPAGYGAGRPLELRQAGGDLLIGAGGGGRSSEGRCPPPPGEP